MRESFLSWLRGEGSAGTFIFCCSLLLQGREAATLGLAVELQQSKSRLAAQERECSTVQVSA